MTSSFNLNRQKSLFVQTLRAEYSRLTDKPISFEMSLGNAGNTLDGQLQQNVASQNEEGERERERRETGCD